MILQGLDDVSDSGSFLSDCHINTEELLLYIPSIKISFLVDYGIDGNRSLAGLSISDYQLTLSSSYRNESVNCLQAGLHGLIHRFSGNYARCLNLDPFSLAGLDWTESIYRIA